MGQFDWKPRSERGVSYTGSEIINVHKTKEQREHNKTLFSNPNQNSNGSFVLRHLSPWRDRGVTISRLPYVFFSFVSRLPPFILFLPLSFKSRCLTPYSDSNRECFGLVQNKKLCCKSNHSALSSAIIEAAFLRHKFTPRCKIFITVFCELQS